MSYDLVRTGKTSVELPRAAVVITDHVKDWSIAREILGDALGDELNADTRVAIVWRHRVDDAFLEAHPGLRGVVRYGAGFDNIDVEAASRHGVVACNNPAYGVDEVADTAVAMAFALVRGILKYDEIARKLPADWQENVQKAIRRTSRTMVGVVGAGRIGSAALLKFRALGFATQFFDPYVPSGVEKVLGSKRAETLEGLLEESDVVSLHTPLNAETAGLVDRSFVEKMKPGAILVNTSRGGVVQDLDAIADALERGQLGGIGFDVMPQEPPQPNRLIKAWQDRSPWIAGRCIINPHTGYYSVKSQAEMHRLAAETAKAILLGKWPPNVLNPRDSCAVAAMTALPDKAVSNRLRAQHRKRRRLPDRCASAASRRRSL